ncbi:helix-turn-helix transcriptional regulator [Longimicrobium sp.]|uniref:helix-turn-helix domain-containing protein n=1 Tax=Longimicrobium sp. TaxID=2029185 RepID=UPI002E35602A|nr:helix-turn-helix transcriptional regulator [Longimicrobium sp.]HEX6041969.1 helix-turn-helix transcriptional regulator [Longimicrobium sp.]
MIIGHITPPGANLFADLGLPPDEAESLYVRSKLMNAILRIMRERKLKQRQAAALFGVSQPRISDVKRGKMEAFTIDSLVDMLAHAGMRVKVQVVDIATEPRTYAVMSDTEETDAEHPEPDAARA